MKRKLTKKEAVDLFRQMWTDMQTELGDCPEFEDRLRFKAIWCFRLFPNDYISHSCPLCEYAEQRRNKLGPARNMICDFCPIEWPFDPIDGGVNCCMDDDGVINYIDSPISEILALPEREVPNEAN